MHKLVVMCRLFEKIAITAVQGYIRNQLVLNPIFGANIWLSWQKRFPRTKQEANPVCNKQTNLLSGETAPKSGAPAVDWDAGPNPVLWPRFGSVSGQLQGSRIRVLGRTRGKDN